MSTDRELSDIPKLTIGTILLAGVPVLALCGCVYNLGFYSTAGMAYFTLLELPDFVVAAAKTLPPALAFASLLFIFGTRNRVESGIQDVRARLSEKTPEEKLRILDDLKREDEDVANAFQKDDFFNWVAFDDDGNWSETKIVFLKRLNIVATIIWFSLVGLCFYGIKVPVLALIVSCLVFLSLFSLTSQIHMIRFMWDDYTASLRMIVSIWAALILGVTFVWGVWDARYEESTPQIKYLISSNEISSATSDFRRVGGNILFFRQDLGVWAVVDRTGITISSHNTFAETEIEEGARISE